MAILEIGNFQTWRASESLFVRPLPFELSGLGWSYQQGVVEIHKPSNHDNVVSDPTGKVEGAYT